MGNKTQNELDKLFEQHQSFVNYIEKRKRDKALNEVPKVKENTYSKKQMFSFAETCMIDLLSTKPENDEYSEISGLDLSRIKKVLNKFKTKI